MKCPTCQHEVSGRFCPNCGTDVQAVTGAGQVGGGDSNATSVLTPADRAALAAREQSPAPPQPENQPQTPFGASPFPQPGAAPGVPQAGQSPYNQPLVQPPYGGSSPPPYGAPQAQSPYAAPQPSPYGQPPPYGAPGQPQYGAQFGQPVPLGPMTRVRRRRRPLILVGSIVSSIIAITVVAIILLALFGHSDDGKIKFGTSYKDTGNTFSIQNEKSSFGPSDHVAWVGFLSDSVDPSTISRTVGLVNKDGTTTTIVNKHVTFTNKSSGNIKQVALTESMAELEELGINPPGTYRVTYLSNGKKEATGTFTLTGASPAGKIFFGTASTDPMIAGLSQQSTFGRGDTMHYAAHLATPQRAGRVEVRIFRIRADGSEQLVSQGLHDDLTDARTYVRLDRISVSDLQSFGASSSGTYILRYEKGSSVLAEGKFTLKL